MAAHIALIETMSDSKLLSDTHPFSAAHVLLVYSVIAPTSSDLWERRKPCMHVHVGPYTHTAGISFLQSVLSMCIQLYWCIYIYTGRGSGVEGHWCIHGLHEESRGTVGGRGTDRPYSWIICTLHHIVDFPCLFNGAILLTPAAGHQGRLYCTIL